MADKVDGIHSKICGGNMDSKLEEIYNLIMTLTTPGCSPSLGPTPRRDTTLSLADTLVDVSTRRSSSDVHGPDISSSRSYSEGEIPEIFREEHSLPESIEKRSSSLPSLMDARSPPHSPTNSTSSSLFPKQEAQHSTQRTRGYTESNLVKRIWTSDLEKQDAALSPILLPPSAIPLDCEHVQSNPPSLSCDAKPQQSPTEDFDHLRFINLDNASEEISVATNATVGQHSAFERMVLDDAFTICKA